MTAVAVAMVLAVSIAVGVMAAAIFSHQLANSPALRAKVRMRWHEVLIRLDDLWIATTRRARALASSGRDEP